MSLNRENTKSRSKSHPQSATTPIETLRVENPYLTYFHAVSVRSRSEKLCGNVSKCQMRACEDQGGEQSCSNIEREKTRETRERGWEEKNLRGFRIFQKHGLADAGWLAPAPGRLQTWLPSSAFLAGHTSESAILIRALFRSPRATRTSLHCSPSVCHACGARPNGVSSPLRAWWTLAEIMAYARARSEWRTWPMTTTTVAATTRVRSRLSFSGTRTSVAREEAPDVDLLYLSVSRRKRERSVRRTQRSSYTARWGLRLVIDPLEVSRATSPPSPPPPTL